MAFPTVDATDERDAFAAFATQQLDQIATTLQARSCRARGNRWCGGARNGSRLTVIVRSELKRYSDSSTRWVR